MNNLLLKDYDKLYCKIISLQKEEKELQSKLQALKENAKNELNNLAIKTHKEISKIEGEIEHINRVYFEDAKRFKRLFDYKPVPRKIDEILLRQLYIMIETSSDATIELQKKCMDTICYYEEQIEKFKSMYELKVHTINDDINNGEIAQNIYSRLEKIQAEYKILSCGADISDLALKAKNYINKFKVEKNIQYQNINIPIDNPLFFSFGYAKCSYPLDKEYKTNLKLLFNEMYDEYDESLLLPLYFSELKDEEGSYDITNIIVSFDEINSNSLYKISQGFIFNILRNYKPLLRRVVYIDTSTYNPEQLGLLSSFVGENNLVDFPKTITEAKKSLQLLEETAMSEPEDNRQKRYLFVHTSDSRNSEILEIVNRISNNCKKYNIITIFLKHQEEEKTIGSISNIPSSVKFYSENGSFFTKYNESVKKCIFFDAPYDIDVVSKNNLLKAYEPKKTDNKYESFFPLTDEIKYINTERTRCEITVPYGLDKTKKDGSTITSLTFEKTDFATFIMGASGSGKSTLIHSIITGIIKNYHPDEVELWLADFKLSEFAPYTQHTPPHIKYIVMDSSPEMIYDFIDLMVKEMRRRQVRLAELKKNDRQETDVSEYLPAIFVIIDEFSALSEAIQQNDSYKRKLDELLSRGRSNGFRFIFASQAFTDGASALSSFAKKQIQSRIAMKNTVDEIKETLSIPTSQITESDRLMIDELPKYYTLHKQEKSGGGYKLTKSLVMYFENTGLSDWENRYEMIKSIKSNMTAVDRANFDSKDPSKYVYKDPIFITSDHLTAFDTEEFLNNEKSLRANQDLSLFYDDKIISFGTPRVLMNNSCIYLSNSARENILLLSNKDELPCSMSVIYSAIRSFMAQKGNVQIWAHMRNKLFRRYKNSHFSNFNCYEGKDITCLAMDKIINNIRNKTQGNDLIILLGMDRLYEEFCDDLGSNPFDDILYSNSNIVSVNIENIFAVTEKEIDESLRVEEDLKELEPLMMEFYEKGEAEGKTEEQLDEEWDKYIDEFINKKYYATESQSSSVTNTQDSAECETKKNSESEHKQTDNGESAVEKKEQEQPISVKKRNYSKDFSTLVQVGSRYGYHFLVVVDDYRQLADMSLKLNIFNHRLAFCTDSTDTSQLIFNSSRAAKLNNHTCFYNGFGQSNDKYLITPYLHKGICWGSWSVDDNNNVLKLYI